jgi:lipopolysaccharide transport protein LptA/LPS export ABC transporter protein LptC
MARKTTTRTLRVLRLVLLLGLVGFLILVYALYRFGKSGLPSNAAEETGVEEERSELAVMEGAGFDYYITQNEKAIARIRAQRVISEEEDEIVLEGISPIEFYREGDTTYRVFADRGRYELDSQNTELVDNVVLQGPNNLELRSDRVEIGHSSQRVTSPDEVRFSMAGEFVGRAGHMVAILKRDRFILSRGVTLRSTSPDREPVELRARRLIYNRNEHLVRAEGNVVFRRGGDYLRADRIHFYLSEDESKLLFISGRWGLEAGMAQNYGQGIKRTAEIEADEFSVSFEPGSGDPHEVELRSKGQGVATLRTTDEASVVRTFTAPVIVGLFKDGDLSHVEAYETVRIREHLAFAPDLILRWICGQRAIVDLNSDGEIVEGRFDDKVEFRQGQSVAHADHIKMSEAPYLVEMIGTPARFANPRGELAAPAITQEGEDGDVRATGGVRGLFYQEGTASTLSVAGAKGPVRVESVEAVWDRATPSYKFEQNVRLWQDENLLLAAEIETIEDSSLVIARGGIRMRLEPTQKESSGDEEEALDSANRQEPAEITSEWMEYSTDTGLVTFHEDVVMIQASRRISCDRAEAEIEEEGGMRSMFCDGNVEVVDNVAGRTVTGNDALYNVDDGEITFHGTPVVMDGEQGEHLEGVTLVYDLNSGGARIERGTGPGDTTLPIDETPVDPIPADPIDGTKESSADNDDGNDPNLSFVLDARF